MASGANSSGQLGTGNTTTVGEVFAVYKEGDVNQPFVDAINYTLGGYTSGIIDSTGKLYTSGSNHYANLGNGYLGTSYTDQDGNKGTNGYLGDYGYLSSQYTFQQVLTTKDVADEYKANALPDNYQAVSMETGHSHSLLLLNDGTLYGSGRQYNMGLSTTSTIMQTHFTRLDGRATGLPQASSKNKIKDVASGYHGSTWVLYENGDLYMGAGESYTLVASDIKFFDLEASRVYAVNTSNQILSCNYSSKTLTTLVAEPNGIVTQVRGVYQGGWGYLNSDNELYLSTTTTDDVIDVPGATNSTATGTTFYKMDNVAFFDLAATSSTKMTYGVMYTNGSISVWGDNSMGQLGNGSVGNGNTSDPDYVPSTPETGVKPEIEVAPEDIPNVEEDTLKDPEDVVFPMSPILYFPPASK